MSRFPIEAQAANFMHKLHFVIDVMRRSSGFKCNIFKSRCILINTFDFACFLLIDAKNTSNYKFVKVPNSTYRYTIKQGRLASTSVFFNCGHKPFHVLEESNVVFPLPKTFTGPIECQCQCLNNRHSR